MKHLICHVCSNPNRKDNGVAVSVDLMTSKIVLERLNKYTTVVLDSSSKGLVRFVKICINKEKYRLNFIHIHGLWDIWLFFFWLVAKLFKIPILLHPHGMLIENALHSKKIRKMIALACFQGLILRGSTVVITSELELPQSLRKKLEINKIFILPFYLDALTRITSLNEIDFIYYGRIVSFKGVDKLCRTCFLLSEYFPNLRVVIVGPESELQCRLRTQYHSLIDRGFLTFTGDLYGNELYSMVAKARFVVVPSRSENFCFSILEGLFLGKPCVGGTECYWGSHSRSDEFGYFMSDWSVRDLTAILRRCLEISPHEYDRMALVARQVSEEYSTDSFVSQLRRLYSEFKQHGR